MGRCRRQHSYCTRRCIDSCHSEHVAMADRVHVVAIHAISSSINCHEIVRVLEGTTGGCIPPAFLGLHDLPVSCLADVDLGCLKFIILCAAVICDHGQRHIGTDADGGTASAGDVHLDSGVHVATIARAKKLKTRKHPVLRSALLERDEQSTARGTSKRSAHIEPVALAPSQPVLIHRAVSSRPPMGRRWRL